MCRGGSGPPGEGEGGKGGAGGEGGEARATGAEAGANAVQADGTNRSCVEVTFHIFM